jgi:hypothetical protein
MAKCQCCGQEIRKRTVRASKSPARWLAEDTAKAEAAIDVLATLGMRGTTYELPASVQTGRGYLTDGQPVQSFALAPASPALIEACASEELRLRRALTEPELLWSIYRRKFAKAGAAYELAAPTATAR